MGMMNLNMADVTFSGNTAASGSATYTVDPMTVQIKRSTFTNHVATGNGGVHHIYSGHGAGALRIYDSVIDGGTAATEAERRR